MKRNHMKKFVNYLSSGKNGRVRRWALCSLGAAAVFGLASSLILSGVTIDSGMGKAAAQELAEIDSSYEVEADGFVTTISVENINGSELADMGEKLLFASVEDPVVPSSSLPEGTDMETDGESAGNNKVEYQVEEVTEGEDYNALVAQFAESTGGSTPTQVMKVTAFQGGKELDLSGCDITLQVTPTDELVNEAGGVTRMSVTVLPLGGEATVQSFSNENMNSGEQLPTVDVSYTVPEGSPAMYAVGYSADGFPIPEKLTENITWKSEWGCIKVDKDISIDLNGFTITREDSNPTHEHDESCHEGQVSEGKVICGLENALFSIVSGGSLTIKDSSTNGTSCISAVGINSVISVEGTGRLNIEGGSIAANNFGDSLIRVKDNGALNIVKGTLQMDSSNRVVYASESGSVNMSGGTITGGFAWAGAGIYATNGAVNISGGSIRGNNAEGHGGGIYIEGNGIVNISGGEITNNVTGWGEGGGVYAKEINMSNGVIRGNIGQAGGGIYIVAGGAASISGGEISENIAKTYGGGIYVARGTVNISDGTINNNRAESGWNYGGGIYMGNGIVEMSGGTISANSTTADGGGIYVASGTAEMSGGTISSNSTQNNGGGVHVENGTVKISGEAIIRDNTVDKYGGGIYVAKGTVEMSDGTITNNTAKVRGGGVHSVSMKMTDGDITHNTAGEINNSASQGGGGIFIDAIIPGNDNYEFEDRDEAMQSCNLHITGGNISNNTSYHTGGGIFVNRGAVAYINGENGHIVQIKHNEAKDQFFKTEGKHGYAGGGIFVEHDIKGSTNAADGGKICIYNALITNNTAMYGGGVAGCGISDVKICSVNGVAVYGNRLTSDREGAGDDYTQKQFAQSDDFFVAGNGLVDPIMMGNVPAKWVGTKDFKTGDNVQVFSEGGFYLKATLAHSEDDATVRSYATVFIEENTSASGGGGVGGNGVMMLGLKEAERDPHSLELEKIVSGMEDSTGSQISPTFRFQIKLTDINGSPLKEISYVNDKGSEASEVHLIQSDKGTYEFDLGNGGYIKILGLNVGTLYEIEEVPTEGYEPSFEVIKGDVENDNSNNVVSGWIAQDNSIVFTNTAFYELPETGGETAAMYYLLGCALMITASAGGWIYRKRSKSI